MLHRLWHGRMEMTKDMSEFIANRKHLPAGSDNFTQSGMLAGLETEPAPPGRLLAMNIVPRDGQVCTTRNKFAIICNFVKIAAYILLNIHFW